MAATSADTEPAGLAAQAGVRGRSRRRAGAVRRWCGLIAAVGAALSACQTPPGQAPAPAQAPVVAYTSAAELGVATATAVTARTPGDFRYAPAEFTADGRFVFTATGAGPGAPGGDGRLSYLDVRDGRPHSVPIAGRPVPGGAGTVVWWQHPDRLMRLDLRAAAPEPELLQTVRLPAPEPPGTPEQAGGVRVLGVGRTATLLARVECPCGSGGDHTHLYLLGADRRVVALGEPAMGSTVSAGVDADGTAVAYAVNGRAGATCAVSTVVQVGLADGAVTKSQVHDADGCSTITHLWWGGGALFAGYAGHDAFGNAPAVPGVWEQTADGWNRVDAGPVLQRLHLTADLDAVLVPDAGRTDVGTLYLEGAGRRTAVADRVAALAAPPRPAG